MKRGLLLLCGTFLLAVGRAAAQDAPIQDEMRFIQELRSQGKSDLALEYLQRLMKNPSPELAKELPLEIAKTRLGAAGEEPDSGKRLNLYAQARDEFQKWLAANAGHPRASEVQLDVAQVAVLQGRTQLSQAFMNPDFDEVTTPEAGKARAMLIDAGAQVQAAAKGLDAQLAKLGDPKTPADKDLKKKLENERLQADLNVALNLFDIAMSYPRNARSTDEAKERGKKVDEARTAFEKVSAKDDQNPICWVARAWSGRCLHENGEGTKARLKYTEILNGEKRIAAEAQRLARYFRLLVIREKFEGTENDAYIIDRAKEWVNDYPGYLKTPEGYGIRYLLGQEYWTLITAPGTTADKITLYLTEARRALRQVEQSENDFTDRARRLKIQVIARQQGGFKEPVEKLKNFEDCYVRAQFEQMEMSREEKEIKDPKELEAKKKAHQDVMTGALERGLKLADESKTAHGEEGLELGNAKAMLAFQYMNGKRFREAIAIAEPFARNDPRSAQAAAAAVYALQCYAENISNQEAAGKTPDELQAERKKLFDFAAFMEKTWPKETPGDMARNQLALLYINDKDPDPAKHANNVQQAIIALGRITPGYPSYTVTQYQLAQFAFGADKEKIPALPGDMDDGYRKRALAALENIPPLPAGADPTTNKVYFLAKIRLAQEYFQLKKFDEMETLTTTLQPKLAGLPLDGDKANDDKLHADFEDSIKGFRLYSRWAKADAENKAADKAAPAEKAAHYTKVMALLDPIVDEIVAKQHPELKTNLPLARGVLDNDLRASIQLNKLERTPIVLNGYKELATGDAADAGAAEVLKQLVVFIPPQLDDLKHKKNDADLKKAQDAFGKILEDTIKPLTGDKLTPKLIYFTAQIYSSMDKHKEAADLLEKVAEPVKDAPKTDVDLYQTIRVLLVKERRLNSETEEARKIMDGIMGDPKTGWGRKKIDALMENVEVMAAEGNNKSAAEFANALIQKLLPKIDADNKIKELYLQCYFLMVENAYRQAMKLKGKPQTAGVKQAANLAVDLAKKHSGFVNDSLRGRFRDLMDAEPDLKSAFVDAYLGTVESGAKDAGAIKDEAQQKKAEGDVAALLYDLEKLWPDYGGDAAKDRATGLLGKDAKLKEQYDALKGVAMP